MASYEDQGTAYDAGAAGHERQGRAAAPIQPVDKGQQAMEALREKGLIRALLSISLCLRDAGLLPDHPADAKHVVMRIELDPDAHSGLCICPPRQYPPSSEMRDRMMSAYAGDDPVPATSAARD